MLRCAHGPAGSQTPCEHPQGAPTRLSTAAGSLSKSFEGQGGMERERLHLLAELGRDSAIRSPKGQPLPVKKHTLINV